MKMKAPLFTLLVTFALVSCSEPESDSTSATTYRVKGVVQELRDETTVIIDHEEIPGYMGQMIMPFKVKDSTEIAELEPGQEIAFDYVVEELASWIERVELTGATGTVKGEQELSAEAEAKLLKVGDVLPDYDFFDEFGEDRALSDHRGEPVALTFVFSRCPVPEYCPRMMNHFSAADKLLKEDNAAPEDYQLLTISFDPFEDTPEVMKAWGEAYDYSPENWSLLTSDSCCTVRELGEYVGLLFDEEEGSIYRHNLRTVVLDGEGRITKIFTDENWEPSDLVAAIKAAAKTS